jgi:hypothetical protein
MKRDGEMEIRRTDVRMIVKVKVKVKVEEREDFYQGAILILRAIFLSVCLLI